MVRFGRQVRLQWQSVVAIVCSQHQADHGIGAALRGEMGAIMGNGIAFLGPRISAGSPVAKLAAFPVARSAEAIDLRPGHEQAGLASSTRPIENALVTAGGFLLRGRWSLIGRCELADYLYCVGVVIQDGRPGLLGDCPWPQAVLLHQQPRVWSFISGCPSRQHGGRRDDHPG